MQFNRRSTKEKRIYLSMKVYSVTEHPFYILSGRVRFPYRFKLNETEAVFEKCFVKECNPAVNSATGT